MNNQLPLYILVNLISFGCGFALTWFFDYKKSMDGELENTDEELEDIKLESEDILSPVTGKAFELSNAKDDVFSSLSLGDGIAFTPEEGKFMLQLLERLQLLTQLSMRLVLSQIMD
ncbi:PTS system glucoside-specific EIICBA component [Lactobacillus helveticus]|nr:PTS system glucoside-specific EIICBA component [Lactobacillus helveticus]